MTTKKFDRNGKETDTDNFYAKVVQNENRITYYCLSSGGSLYDVNNPELNYRKQKNWQFNSVSKNVFDTYVRYLQTNRKQHLHRAQREI